VGSFQWGELSHPTGENHVMTTELQTRSQPSGRQKMLKFTGLYHPCLVKTIGLVYYWVYAVYHISSGGVGLAKYTVCTGINDRSLGSVALHSQWEFQDPKMEVPTIYKAYVRPM